MKKLIISIVFIFVLSGCSSKIILVPQSEYYPIFNTDEFNISKPINIDLWVEVEIVNGKEVTYLVSNKDEMLFLIEDVKNLRLNYNVLLNNLNIFNSQIKELNKLKNKKQPKNIDKIDNSIFK